MHDWRWPQERVTELKVLWDGGTQRASLIAEKLGMTRNAVLGFLHRNKEQFVRNAESPVRASKPPKSKRRQSQVNRHVRNRIASQKPLEAPTFVSWASDEDIPLEQRVSLLELSKDTCRWPIGEEPATMMFCGAKPLDGQPYCECHHARAYTRVIRHAPAKPFNVNVSGIR